VNTLQLHPIPDRSPPALLEDPVVGSIYEARINNLTNFGAFATLEGFRRKVEGLVHISQLRNERVNVVADVVQRNQKVKVKVLKLDPAGKISLSMKEVDQQTGEDLNPPLPAQALRGRDDLMPDDMAVLMNPEAPWANPEEGGSSGGRPGIAREPVKRSRVRLSTPERWELRQMMGGGVAWESIGSGAGL